MARRKRVEKVTIASHKHCKECGIAISSDKTFCSTECEAGFKNRTKRRRRTDYIFIAIIAVVLILTFFSSM